MTVRDLERRHHNAENQERMSHITNCFLKKALSRLFHLLYLILVNESCSLFHYSFTRLSSLTINDFELLSYSKFNVLLISFHTEKEGFNDVKRYRW